MALWSFCAIKFVFVLSIMLYGEKMLHENATLLANCISGRLLLSYFKLCCRSLTIIATYTIDHFHIGLNQTKSRAVTRKPHDVACFAIATPNDWIFDCYLQH